MFYILKSAYLYRSRGFFFLIIFFFLTHYLLCSSIEVQFCHESITFCKKVQIYINIMYIYDIKSLSNKKTS